MTLGASGTARVALLALALAASSPAGCSAGGPPANTVEVSTASNSAPALTDAGF